MANNPKRIQDPTEAAMSAIQEALNLREDPPAPAQAAEPAPPTAPAADPFANIAAEVAAERAARRRPRRSAAPRPAPARPAAPPRSTKTCPCRRRLGARPRRPQSKR